MSSENFMTVMSPNAVTDCNNKNNKYSVKAKIIIHNERDRNNSRKVLRDATRTVQIYKQ